VLGKLASFFVDLESQKPVPNTPTEKQAGQPKSAIPTQVAPKPSVVIPGQVNDEMAKILEDAIREADIPGFDYIEFRDILANMRALNIPEPQMFQAAFASAQIAKVTKIQLLEAIDFYIKVIETKAGEFRQYVAGIETTDVTGKNQEISVLEKQIEEDATKIQELTTEIGKRRQKQDAIRMEKAQAELDIKNKTAAFEATKAVVVDKLGSDREKINTYIQ
jgi:hypothetical protein